jgi:hypothetical protein
VDVLHGKTRQDKGQDRGQHTIGIPLTQTRKHILIRL